MRRRFAQFIASRGVAGPAEANRLAGMTPQFREVLGAIAMGHGLITLEQLEDILNHLEGDSRFGEVGIELGYLTHEQVERLLAIQEMQDVMEIGEALLLQGRVTRQQLLGIVASFFAGVEAPTAA